MLNHSIRSIRFPDSEQAKTEEKQLMHNLKYNKTYEKVTDPVFATNVGFVSLTLDDGPSFNTEQLLETLEQKKAQAIFFMIGENVKKHKNFARQVAEAGHVIGNHSYTHPFLNKMSPKEAREELEKTTQVIEDVTGVTPIYFRPPYGAYNETIILMASEMNMKLVMWSADPKDYSFNTESAVLKATEPLIASRKILLLHDLKESTAKALPVIIDDIRNKDLQITAQYEV